MSRRSKLPAPLADAVEQLHAIAEAHPGAVEVVAVDIPPSTDSVTVRITIDTASVEHRDGGLELEPTEAFVLELDGRFPWRPPTVYVEHDRFVGHPHVLLGRVLCIFLDEQREWHPALGVLGVVNALDKWLNDAAGGRFDPADALYHPVGGVLWSGRGTPLIVVRNLDVTAGRTFMFPRVRRVGDHRINVGAEGAAERCLAIATPRPLSLGVGNSLVRTLVLVSNPTLTGLGLPPQPPTPDDTASALARAAAMNPAGTPLVVLLAAPNPATKTHHLIAGQIDPATTDLLRDLAAAVDGAGHVPVAALPSDATIHWFRTSDERPVANRRRDEARPAARFFGRSVDIWGCGGLGSWIAEFIVRAGAARVVLRDYATAITGGLLVRQNFTETDIGLAKPDALAKRLLAISPDLEVRTHDSTAYAVLGDGRLPACDLIIDATVSVGVDHLLDLLWDHDDRPLVAQVTTDVSSGALGLLTVAGQDTQRRPADIDHAVGRAVTADPTLEGFHTFWNDHAKALVPTPGCSVPTYHGSAADVAAVAATFVNLLGLHLDGSASGAHLIATPTASGAISPAHVWIEDPGGS